MRIHFIKFNQFFFKLFDIKWSFMALNLFGSWIVPIDAMILIKYVWILEIDLRISALPFIGQDEGQISLPHEDLALGVIGDWRIPSFRG